MSHWSEETPQEAELVYVNFGSLKSESVERLRDAGLLSSLTSDEDRLQTVNRKPIEVTSMGKDREIRGTPWFEEMIEGSELGRLRRRRGGETSLDGKTMTEWEITEFESGKGDDEIQASGKRKHDSLAEGQDVHMGSA